MSAPFFGTNILVYTYSNDPKRTTARQLSRSRFVIGVQTLNEFTNAIRRVGMTWDNCRVALADIEELAEAIIPTTLADQKRSVQLAERHQLSVFDALMLAIALRAGCTTFYSEDMHHGLVIENQLTITNPFI